MELDKIYQLMDKFEQSSLTSFEYRDQDFEIQMGKKGHGKTTVTPQPAPLPNQPVIDPTPVTPTPVSTVSTPVGLIQAMQMMRPVVAKQAGTVKAFLVKNGEEVNFGQPLIQLIPDTPDDI